MRSGDQAAADKLGELVYSTLRRRAHHLLASEKRDAIVTTCGLVNEAYARLAPNLPVIQDRRHLLGLLTKKMREILVDWARQRLKGGGGAAIGQLDTAGLRQAEAFELKKEHRLTVEQILEIDHGLSQLEEQSPEGAEMAKVLEVRYFAGLTIEEAGEHLGLSRSTTHRIAVLAIAELAKILQ
jgi:RNA polymerase sigma factor (TIGR02999 family)